MIKLGTTDLNNQRVLIEDVRLSLKTQVLISLSACHTYQVPPSAKHWIKLSLKSFLKITLKSCRCPGSFYSDQEDKTQTNEKALK